MSKKKLTEYEIGRVLEALIESMDYLEYTIDVLDKFGTKPDFRDNCFVKNLLEECLTKEKAIFENIYSEKNPNGLFTLYKEIPYTEQKDFNSELSIYNANINSDTPNSQHLYFKQLGESFNRGISDALSKSPNISTSIIKSNSPNSEHPRKPYSQDNQSL